METMTLSLENDNIEVEPTIGCGTGNRHDRNSSSTEHNLAGDHARPGEAEEKGRITDGARHQVMAEEHTDHTGALIRAPYLQAKGDTEGGTANKTGKIGQGHPEVRIREERIGTETSHTGNGQLETHLELRGEYTLHEYKMPQFRGGNKEQGMKTVTQGTPRTSKEIEED